MSAGAQPTSWSGQPTLARWERLTGAFATRIDATVALGDGTVAVISQGRMVIHSLGNDLSGPYALQELRGWPPNWRRIDAALEMEPGRVYLFRGRDYLILDAAAREIVGGDQWVAWPQGWPNDQLDAAVRWNAQQMIFFRGGEWAVFDASTQTFGNAMSVAEWEGWPASWANGFDDAVNTGNGIVYFFRRGEVLPYILSAQTFVRGFPQLLPGAIETMMQEAHTPLPKSTRTAAVAEAILPTPAVAPAPSAAVAPVFPAKAEPPTTPAADSEDSDEEIVIIDEGEDEEVVEEDEEVVEVDEEEEQKPAPPTDRLVKINKTPVTVENKPDHLEKLPAAEPFDPNRYYDDFQPFASDDLKGMAFLPQPNSDWLGAGFDVVYADPTNFADVPPGCPKCGRKTNRAFQLIVSNVRTTDRAYYLHYLTQRDSYAGTSGRTQSAVIKSAEDIRQQITTQFSANAGVAGVAAFSGSAFFRNMFNAKSEEESISIYTSHRRPSARMVLHLTDTDLAGKKYRQQLTPAFRQSVANLHPGGDCSAYERFIHDYGTHYAGLVVFGGLFNMHTRITRSMVEKTRLDRKDFTIRAQLELQRFSGGASVSRSAENQNTEMTSSLNEATTRWTAGGDGESDYDKWVATVDEKPMPIEIEFHPFSELLTTVFFPLDSTIDVKRAHLDRCTNDYLSREARQFDPGPITNDFFEPRIRRYRVRVDSVNTSNLKGRASADSSLSFVVHAGKVRMAEHKFFAGNDVARRDWIELSQDETLSGITVEGNLWLGQTVNILPTVDAGTNKVTNYPPQFIKCVHITPAADSGGGVVFDDLSVGGRRSASATFDGKRLKSSGFPCASYGPPYGVTISFTVERLPDIRAGAP